MVGPHEAASAKDLRAQQKQDIREDKGPAKEYNAPFKGSQPSMDCGLNAVKASAFSALAFLYPVRLFHVVCFTDGQDFDDDPLGWADLFPACVASERLALLHALTRCVITCWP